MPRACCENHCTSESTQRERIDLNNCPAPPWEQVTSLLRSIDRSARRAFRDFTVLYLAVRYGLRSSELVHLTLDDIDWRAGTLKVTQTKTRQTLLLPLTNEAGDILARYLRDGRLRSEHRELFLRRVAPSGPLAPTACMPFWINIARRSAV